jgi:hypothetical protein
MGPFGALGSIKEHHHFLDPWVHGPKGSLGAPKGSLVHEGAHSACSTQCLYFAHGCPSWILAGR